MSRIQPNTSVSAKAQELLDGVKKGMGSVPNMFRVLAHSEPSLGFAVQGFGAFNGSKLSPALREQIALTVSGANGCDYCASAHTALGKSHKVSDSELAQNLVGKSADKKTQAALTFASNVVEQRGKVSDKDLEAVRAAGYADAEILDIVSVTVFNIFTNYINNVAKTEIDFPLISTKAVSKAA